MNPNLTLMVKNASLGTNSSAKGVILKFGTDYSQNLISALCANMSVQTLKNPNLSWVRLSFVSTNQQILDVIETATLRLRNEQDPQSNVVEIKATSISITS